MQTGPEGPRDSRISEDHRTSLASVVEGACFHSPLRIPVFCTYCIFEFKVGFSDNIDDRFRFVTIEKFREEAGDFKRMEGTENTRAVANSDFQLTVHESMRADQVSFHN